MADDAFALSPIHARAALPTDADYDAIQEAFMETSRGRWFLTEYAKRNRNADTRMVLAAVERLEAGLATQRAQAEAAAADAAAAQLAAAQAAAAQVAEAQVAAAQLAAAEAAAAQAAAAEAKPQVDLWPELAKAFARARIQIAQRLVRDSNDEAFETIRASTETLKSISWALRERGFDVRICDFLDVQVNKITDGCTGLMAETSVASDAEAEILATFDELIAHVEGLTSSSSDELANLDMVVDAVADAMIEDDGEAMLADDEIEPPPAPVDEPPQAAVAEVAPADGVVESIRSTETDGMSEDVAAGIDAAPRHVTDPDAAFREIYGDDSDIEIVDAVPADDPPPPAAAIPTEPEINRLRLYEAKLEPYRHAETGLQTGAPVDDIEIVDLAGVDASAVPDRPAISAAAPVAAVAEAAPTPAAAAREVAPAEPPKPSLGQALLDSGVIASAPTRQDPLAPFRRMSQAERVAFFT